MTENHSEIQPLRELNWLMRYFRQHSREDLALEISEQIRQLRHKAQDSLDEPADVRSFEDDSKRASGQN